MQRTIAPHLAVLVTGAGLGIGAVAAASPTTSPAAAVAGGADYPIAATKAATITQAKRAVRHEVQDRFPQAQAIDVHSCKQLTGRRFKCAWSASEQAGQPDGKHGFATGNARVTVYQYGADVRLSNIKCYSGLGPHVGVDFCAGV